MINRIKSVKYAVNGAIHLLKTEGSIQIQVSIALIMTVIGFFFNLSASEWMAQFLAMGLVITAESLNTAIEKLADFVHPDYHLKIGIIKDISAGAAVFAAFVAIIIGGIIYLPKILSDKHMRFNLLNKSLSFFFLLDLLVQ